MAQRGKPIPASLQQRIASLAALLSVRRTAREVGVAPNTVRKYSETPARKSG